MRSFRDVGICETRSTFFALNWTQTNTWLEGRTAMSDLHAVLQNVLPACKPSSDTQPQFEIWLIIFPSMYFKFNQLPVCVSSRQAWRTLTRASWRPSPPLRRKLTSTMWPTSAWWATSWSVSPRPSATEWRRSTSSSEVWTACYPPPQ